jgi:hypothetical protein
MGKAEEENYAALESECEENVYKGWCALLHYFLGDRVRLAKLHALSDKVVSGKRMMYDPETKRAFLALLKKE